MIDIRPPKRALVLGVNGQDGSYLAQALLRQGWRVLGVGRQRASRWLPLSDSFSYHALDLAHLQALSAFLIRHRPDTIFHFAAVHGPSGFLYEEHWQEVHAINTVTVHLILEFLRSSSPDTLLVYASSAKVFDFERLGHISESSPRQSSCIYTTTKNAATDLINYYRHKHKIKASVVWTFNHESPRRGTGYFVPQIVDNLAKSIVDTKHTGEIATLNFWCDWGDAEEFMQIVASQPESLADHDFILATGTTLWARDVVQAIFTKYYSSWHNHLVEKNPYNESTPKIWHADITLLESTLKLRPQRTIFNIVDDILRLNYPKAWEIFTTHRGVTV